jgi:decaprenyl-phosphate phosphoribosyltransferase
VLARYSKGYLESVLSLCAAVSIAGYCLWAFEATGLAARAHGREVFIQLTVVPVVIAVLYVLLLLDRGDGGAPEDLAFSDRTLQALAVAWAALVLIGVYG